ncbi:hypothetical protein CF651_18930 [Paenibacillus rigui]|uniref:Uncharacterized protein n=1 Tax=Paenibacillus rigui TaxID=554312 RepID=A0A229UMR9_9BACL|nr:hypothetical protein CF651_18930 [Paenibacillus rigui]
MKLADPTHNLYHWIMLQLVNMNIAYNPFTIANLAGTWTVKSSAAPYALLNTLEQIKSPQGKNNAR